MSTTPDPATLVGTSAQTIETDVMSVAGTVLQYAAVLAATVVGWRWARKFVK